MYNTKNPQLNSVLNFSIGCHKNWSLFTTATYIPNDSGMCTFSVSNVNTNKPRDCVGCDGMDCLVF